MKFEFTKNGKALGMQGWSMSHESNESTAYAPIHFGGEAVAVVMIKGEETVGRLVSIGQTLADRANAYEILATALQDCANHPKKTQRENIARKALAAAGVK